MSNKRIYSADSPPAFKVWAPTELDEIPVPAPAAPPSEEAFLHYIENQETRGGGETTDIPAAEAEPPSIEELDALRAEAREQGYAEGLAQGRSDAADEIESLKRLLENARLTLEQLQAGLAPQVLDLALDFTRHILRSELQLKPQHIIPLVQEMTQILPQPGGHPKLHLHPDDVELVRTALGAELEPLGWKLVPDSTLRRGDCMIETHQSELNARLATRWQQLCDTLGLKRPLDDEPA